MIKALLVSLLATSAFSHKVDFERDELDERKEKGGSDGRDHGRPERARRAPPTPPAPVINTCNSTCLTGSFFDFYGDGWDGVLMNIEKEGDSDVTSVAPTCKDREVTGSLCPDSDGTYYFTAVHPNSSYVPENYWEVFWTLTVHNCDFSVANVYTGGYNSSIIFDYIGNEWKIVYWENLWDNEKKCDACGDAKVCKPKKPKSKKDNKKPGKSGPGGKPINGGGGESDTTNTTSTSNTTSVAKTKPRYGPPAVNLRLTMFDEEGDGWWLNNYKGQSWFLADDRREKLFFTGTLCDGSSGSCNLCLGDGSYTLRFTGEDSNFTSWDFCGVTGHRASELTFHVKKGKCYADSVVDRKTDCHGYVESTVTLAGVIAMSGFKTEFTDESTYTAVASAVADIVNGINFNSVKVQVLSTTLDSRPMSDASSIVQDYLFEMSFVAENEPFKIDGRSNAAVESLASTIATTLSSAMSSGDFQSKIHMQASLLNVVSLSNAKDAELLSLEVTAITYTGTKYMAASTLTEWTASSEYGSSYAVSSNLKEVLGFLGVAVVGFVAFVGVMAGGIKHYEALPTESSHNLISPSSEMDSSIAPPRVTVFETDATPVSTSRL